MEDVNSYKSKGANHFSASSVFFNPYKFTKLYIQYSLSPYENKKMKIKMCK